MRHNFLNFLTLFFTLLGCANTFAITQLEPLEGYHTVLGRPTDQSITLTISGENQASYKVSLFQNGRFIKEYTGFIGAKNPQSILIEGLESSSEYGYELFISPKEGAPQTLGPYNFSTAKQRGEAFKVVMQGDSHLLNKADKALYEKTLTEMSDQNADLFFDLGDTFINDNKENQSQDAIEDIVVQQIPFLSIVAKQTPMLYVLGNHEGEYGYLKNGTTENLPHYSVSMRKKYFPNPQADDFYLANKNIDPISGPLENYYAFEWGDALFVVIDPYNYTMIDPTISKDPWDWTIGDKQYHWLQETLEKSQAKYKFVMAHHLLGNQRGGEKISTLYEWGGEDQRGNFLFKDKRANWDLPIHDLMVQEGVNIFFQGHDHLFAREERDGLIYQTLPKPGELKPDHKSNESYFGGDVLTNSGYLTLNIDPLLGVQVDYHRTSLAGGNDIITSDIPYSYRISPEGQFLILHQSDREEDWSIYVGKENDKNSLLKGEKRVRADKKNKREQPEEKNDLPEGGLLDFKGQKETLSTILTQPTSHEIFVNTYFKEEGEFYISYEKKGSFTSFETKPIRVEADSYINTSLDKLEGNSCYTYQVLFTNNQGEISKGPQGSFNTPKEAGEGFSFLIEADPHFDDGSGETTYKKLLEKMKQEGADFIIDLGDVSMAEKLNKRGYSTEDRYTLVRSFWDDLGSDLPFYMVLGNHDGEAKWNYSKRDSSGPLNESLRTTMIGETSSDPFYNRLSDFIYSFEWGDVQIISLDPFYSMDTKPRGDNWEWSLGDEQYHWLETTLKKSDAQVRFVFIHNLVGGLGKDNRGGAEGAKFYEWGGDDPEQGDIFKTMRPLWDKPIHDLLEFYGVKAVFHGHDHFFAKESFGNIVYQLVPQPSLDKKQNPEAMAKEYGYKEGVFLSSPGYLKISVEIIDEKPQVTLELKDELGVLYSYTL